MPHQGRRQCHGEKSVPDFISMGKELCRAGLQLTSYREERVREITRERVIDHKPVDHVDRVYHVATLENFELDYLH